jgi:hypothetical protein
MVLEGEPKRKSPLGRCIRNWENNIKKHKKLLEDMNWIYVANDRDKWQGPVNTVRHLRVP